MKSFVFHIAAAIALVALSPATSAQAESARTQLTAQPGDVALTLPPGISRLDNALVYRPAKTVARWPVLVLLHGAGQDPRTFLDLVRDEADRVGYIVLAPKSKGLTWDFSRRRAYTQDPVRIDAALRALFASAPVDSDHVALAGFSDGASYALSLGTANAQLFRGVLALSPGFFNILGPVNPQQRVFVSHGRQDNILPFENVIDIILPALKGVGLHPRTHWFMGPHKMDREIYKEGVDYVLGLDR